MKTVFEYDEDVIKDMRKKCRVAICLPCKYNRLCQVIRSNVLGLDDPPAFWGDEVIKQMPKKIEIEMDEDKRE